MITLDIANAIALHLQENLDAETYLQRVMAKHDIPTPKIILEYETGPMDNGSRTTIWDNNAPPAHKKALVHLYYWPDFIHASSQLPVNAAEGWLRERRYDYTDPILHIRIEDYVEVLLQKWALYKFKTTDATGKLTWPRPTAADFNH